MLRPRRVLREIYRALMTYGTIHTGVSPEDMVGTARQAARLQPLGTLAGPGAGHPERLCADVPLTPVERALARELESR